MTTVSAVQQNVVTTHANATLFCSDFWRITLSILLSSILQYMA